MNDVPKVSNHCMVSGIISKLGMIPNCCRKQFALSAINQMFIQYTYKQDIYRTHPPYTEGKVTENMMAADIGPGHQLWTREREHSR